MPESKVLFVVNSLSGGGAEASAMLVAQALQSREHKVNVIAINKSNEAMEHISSGVKELDRSWNSPPLLTLMVYFRFVVEVLKNRPKIMVAHCEMPELFCALIPVFNITLIAVEHTSRPWAGRRFLGTAVRRILKFRGVSWVTVSSDASPIWKGSRNPRYIANPINLKRHEASKIQRETQAIFIGRLRSEKRPSWLISTALEAGVTVDVFGDGVEKEILQKRFANNESSIRFHGFVMNPWEMISKDSLVVVPSEYEGDGMVVAEAIVNEHSVLLADNSDLRRFDLPEANYFQNKNQLQSKLSEWKRFGRKTFKVQDHISNSLRESRNIHNIVQQWEAILYKHRQE